MSNKEKGQQIKKQKKNKNKNKNKIEQTFNLQNQDKYIVPTQSYQKSSKKGQESTSEDEYSKDQKKQKINIDDNQQANLNCSNQNTDIFNDSDTKETQSQQQQNNQISQIELLGNNDYNNQKIPPQINKQNIQCEPQLKQDNFEQNLQDRLQQAENELRMTGSFQQQITKYQQSETDWKAKYNKLQSDSQTAQNKLENDSKTKYEQLKSELLNDQKKYNQLDKEFKEQQNQNQQLTNDKLNLQQKVDELTIQIQRIELNNLELQTKLRKEEQNQSLLNEQINKINQTYSEEVKQLKEERQKLQDSDAQKENFQSIEQESQYKIALKNQQQQSSQLEQNIQLIEITQLKIQLAQFEYNNQQNQQFTEDLKQKIDQLENEKSQLQSKLEVSDQNQKNRDELLVKQKQISNTLENDLKLFKEKYNQLYLDLNSKDLNIKNMNYELEINKKQIFLLQLNVDELPHALIFDKTDKGMKQMMNILFENEQIGYFERKLQKQSFMQLIPTDPFDFDDIDQRERQIEQYRKVFKRYPNKFASLLITVPFERIDVIKKNIMDIYKYINQLKVPISIIVTDFHLSENKEQDEKFLRNKLGIFKPKQFIFIGKDTNKQDLIYKLKKTLPELNQNNFYPLKVKDTMFEDEDKDETQKIMEQFKQQFQKY